MDFQETERDIAGKDEQSGCEVGSGMAKAVSVLLHPFLMPLWIGLVLLYGPTYFVILPNSIKLYILGTFVLTTFLFPAFVIGLMHSLRILPDLSLSGRRERTLPMLIVVVGYCVCYYLLRNFISIGLFPQIVIGASLTILVCFGINLFWKISLHMAAIGGAISVFLYVILIGYGHLEWVFAVSILLAGCLGSARLCLGKHNVYQVFSGAFAGIGAMWLVLYLL